MPVPTWIDRMRRSDEMPARSGALLYVLRHPHGLVGTAEDGLVREIDAERRWVIKRRRQHGSQTSPISTNLRRVTVPLRRSAASAMSSRQASWFGASGLRTAN